MKTYRVLGKAGKYRFFVREYPTYAQAQAAIDDTANHAEWNTGIEALGFTGNVEGFEVATIG